MMCIKEIFALIGFFIFICIDDTIRVLEESRLDCYCKGILARCLRYADDVILLLGSMVKLLLMLDICYFYAMEWKFTLMVKNPAK